MPIDINGIRAYGDGFAATHAVGATFTAPTNGTSALHVNLKEVGAIAEGGLTESTSQERTKKRIWQKGQVVKTLKGEFAKEWKFAAAEQSLLTLSLQYPGSTITQTTEGVSIAEKAPADDIRGWVLQGVEGGRRQRVYIPFAEITERGDIVWEGEEITVFEWTLSAYPDANDNYSYRYIVDPRLAIGA